MNRIVELALLYCGQADEIVAGIGNIPIGSYGVAGSRTGAAYRSVFWLPDFLYTVAKAAAFAQQNKLRFTEKNIIRYLKKHLANINNVLRTHIKSPSNNKGHRTAAQRISAIAQGKKYYMYRLAGGYPAAWEPSISPYLDSAEVS